jgi:hypothetical protein
MNLSSEARLKSLIKEHSWNGETLHFRKLSIAEWKRCNAARTAVVPVDEMGHPVNEADGPVWGAIVLSKMLCDAAGVLTLDTDDSRKSLEQLSESEMWELLKVGLVWSGVWIAKADELGEQKKS